MFTFDSQKNRALVMGILNVTPDSFSDGGDSFSSEDALKNALKMQNDGADIIDIGACSTAPKNKPVPLNEELSRLKKVFPLIVHNSAAEFATLIFSAGRVGTQVETSLDNLRKIVPYKLFDICVN